MIRVSTISSFVSLLSIGLCFAQDPAVAEKVSPGSSFLEAKTLFQTNRAYDPRIAIAVDGVMVHCHGAKDAVIRDSIASWKQHGYKVGRMFFSDSDAENIYWKGKWDGKPHLEDIERDEKGDLVKCSRIRPYMLPTEGWTKYLEQMAVASIDVGADAILPEEPLAHVDTGYEKSFQSLWVKRYGKPWQPESASPEARFLTAQLKSELYRELVRRLAETTRTRSRELNRTVNYILPVHAPYSNIAAKLTAPLGASLGIDLIDGYIGQVWTGPVNWALDHYGSSDESFFASAYALYDYFASLTVGSSKKLWLLADPVEDNPHHRWSEFEAWYRHCLVAELFFPEVIAFEVMPWPERVFLPGHATGGGTPAPEPFRIGLLSAIQVLQEVPEGGQWCIEDGSSVTGRRAGRIGMAISDTLMWEKEERPPLNGVYGLLLPLIQKGIPVSACLMERCRDADYLSRFSVMVLSYEAWKPLSADVNDCLVDWVKRGGCLIVLGEADDLGGGAFWWKGLGYTSALSHLLAKLDVPVAENTDHRVGKGWVYRRTISPRRFADPQIARSEYLPLVETTLAQVDAPIAPSGQGKFCMRRGPFLIAHTFAEPLHLTGKLIDIFDPELPLLDGAILKAGSSGLYRDVSPLVDGPLGGERHPCVLHTTHRLIREHHADNVSEITVRGPAGTPAVIRMFGVGKGPKDVTAHDTKGNRLNVLSRQDGETLRLQFPNQPEGAVAVIQWSP